jgi:F-type H+-transporting ATPase subunit epsilon
MADGRFQLAVVTPEVRLVDVTARAVVFRSSDGDLTVLDGHTPLVADVLPGEVRVDEAEGGTVRLAVHGGYLQVETGVGVDTAADGAVAPGGGDGRITRVTLLAGVAERAEDIDTARAEAARERAESAVAQLRAATAGTATVSEDGTVGGESVELAEAEAAQQRAEVRLAVAGVTTGR